MYKILVVDDESVVREGIKNNINWSEYGFELVGGCKDGSEAIEVIENNHLDVVITDICMPLIDGIELTRYISNNYSNIKVIILTGYDEFEYAQQAIKLKALDFILKPITAKEFCEVLEKVKSDLDEEVANINNLNNLESQLTKSLPLLRERFLKRLVSGFYGTEKIQEKLDYFNIKVCGEFFLVISVDVDDYDEMNSFYADSEEELLLFAVNNVCEEIVLKYNNGIVFQNDNQKIVIILNGEDSQLLNENGMIISEEIRSMIEKYLKFTVTVGISDICSSLKLINTAYEESMAALDYRFLVGKNKVTSIKDMEENNRAVSRYKKVATDKLITGIKTGTIQNVDDIITEIVENLKNSYTSLQQCYIQVQQILISIMDTLNELGINIEAVFGNSNIDLSEVYKFKALDEIECWLKDISRNISVHISKKRTDHFEMQAIKAVEYIKNNYNDQNISLNSICKHLLVSTSYFSMIIKNYVGETFIEYLTRVRVEKASELLKNTNLKTYEIAEKVGYKDPHYFSLIFKKATGLSPTEFREKI
ncbi:response regulator [Petroclostridium sp. X23]|uniref:response regulator n=1 Tax=Petroclostridium sp. X23 TaxID=3045146 RepID=UPI0024AE115F|nr:response regulator [Petroclostridium sp. X23]WHH58071.1 response regulator [Petroclostridium sp. X23]